MMTKNKVIIFDFDGTLIDQKAATRSFLCGRERIVPLPQAAYISSSLMRKLASRYRLGIVTGSPDREVIPVMASLNMLYFFDARLIITADDIAAPKKTGKSFVELVNRLYGSRVVFIGDSANDEIGSRIAGVPFIRVRNARGFQEHCEMLSRAIGQAIEILEWNKATLPWNRH